MLFLLKRGEEINFSFCMFNRNCIFNIGIIINIAFVVVVVMFQNGQVMITSFDCFQYNGCFRQSLDCWSSYNFRGKMGVGRRKVIMVSLQKSDVRNVCEIQGGNGVDPNESRYFGWLGGSGGGGSDILFGKTVFVCDGVGVFKGRFWAGGR